MYQFGSPSGEDEEQDFSGIIDIEPVKEEKKDEQPESENPEKEDTFLKEDAFLNNGDGADALPLPGYMEDRHNQENNDYDKVAAKVTASAETPSPAAMQAAGTSIGLLPSLINALGNRRKLVANSSGDADSLAMRLQQAREARAFDHIILLEERMSQCRQSVREVCGTALWQRNKTDIEAGSKDARDFFLELVHGKSQEHLELNGRIREMALGLRDFERQIQQVKNACEKAGLDSSETLRKAEYFLEEFQRSPASSLIPDPSDGIAFNEKLKEMLKHVREIMQSLFGKPDEDSGPDMQC